MFSVIHVESYLRARMGEFIPVADVSELPPNPRHIEGAVDLVVNGVSIIDQSLWDDVDALWAYISDMVMALNESDESSTLFPDQPIKLTFRRVGGGLLLVSLTNGDVRRAVSVDERAFISALQESGRSFFARLKELVPQKASGYDDALGRLAAYKNP